MKNGKEPIKTKWTKMKLEIKEQIKLIWIGELL